MKHLQPILVALFTAFFSLHALSSMAQIDEQEAAGEESSISADTVQISLLTCGPGNEVYSLYGHTAVRYYDKANGIDVAVNYGMFSFSQRFFILRFIFGLTDYEMGIYPTDIFIKEYRAEHRWVREQVLNLTAEDKSHIAEAIDRNYRPENRVYRYNYFYDNCTTRARDLVINHILGVVDYHFPNNTNSTEGSYREEIHQYDAQQPWTRLGNDLLLGLKADWRINDVQRQFLPNNIMEDFERATIKRDGHEEPLVIKANWLIPEETTADSSGNTLRPTTFFCILLLVTIALTLIEWRSKRAMWIYDTILIFVSGMAGLVLFAMIFSAHPTVSVNLQILILNPLSLLFLYPAIKRERRGQGYWFWKLLFSLVILFFIGGFFQSYAEGMFLLASSLLVRTTVNLRR